MTGPAKVVYVVIHYTNPDESAPIGVCDTLDEAKTFEPGGWHDYGDGTWTNGPCEIRKTPYWPKAAGT